MYISDFGIYTSGLIKYGSFFQSQQFSGIEQRAREVMVSGGNIMVDFGYQGGSNTFGISSRVKFRTTPVKNASFNKTRSLTQLYYKYFF